MGVAARFAIPAVITYCETSYFRCILISRFWNVEISLHFNLAFAQCSTSIYQAFDRQTEFSRVFNFAILCYSRNSWKFDAREKYVLYSSSYLVLTGSLGFIVVTWIPMGSCSSEWVDFVGGRWCGLGRLPHFWCGLGLAELWGRFPWGWRVYSVLGIVSRYQTQ